MEPKKLDLNSIIGFALIFVIIAWMIYNNQPTKEQLAAEKAKKEQVAKEQKSNKVAAKVIAETRIDSTSNDSLQLQKLQGTLGGFAYSATLPSAKDNFTTVENDRIKLKIANKGGYIVEATLKNFESLL
jgi:YidC/Oxa1 family membrane protein insertase